MPPLSHKLSATGQPIQTILLLHCKLFWVRCHILLQLCHNLDRRRPRRGDDAALEYCTMKKFLILAASVSALALAGCNKAEEKKVEAPAAPAAEAPAAPAAAPAAPAAPAAEAPAAPAAAEAPAAAPAAAGIDAGVQATIDQLKAGAAAMTAEQKTAALAQVRTAAEAAAKAAGGDDAAAKAAGDAAEGAAKSALGM